MTTTRHIVLTRILAVILAGGVAAGASAQARQDAGETPPTGQGQMEGMDHGQMTGEGRGTENTGSGAAAIPDSPATEAYRAANMAMHSGMDIEFTGDPDIDFVLGMIPHHQGAVDMARIVLEHGQDPELRQLAEAIIEAQEAEIAFMREWLAEHGE